MNRNEKINETVNNFFANADNGVVYATPDTDNHSANFYGDSYVCELSKDDVINCIDCAISDWHFPDENGDDMTGDELTVAAIETILDDLQYEKPEDD